MLFISNYVTRLWFPHISGQTAQGIDLQLHEYICYGTLQAWLIFGRAPMKFNRLLTSDCSTSFRAFSDKPFKGLIFNLANAFVMVLSRLHLFLAGSDEVQWSSDLWLLEQFLRICGQTADRIEFDFGGPIYYGHCPTWLTFPHAPFNCREPVLVHTWFGAEQVTSYHLNRLWHRLLSHIFYDAASRNWRTAVICSNFPI